MLKFNTQKIKDEQSKIDELCLLLREIHKCEKKIQALGFNYTLKIHQKV